ncbi:MAG: alpha/beta hydrolase-fold protein [Armatimonadetes bacterium]|nr:alpha/beta hydrolase-fold protein [Armatimonadota bacterium]
MPAALGLMLLLPVAEPLKYRIWTWLVLSLPHRGHLEEVAVPAPSMGRGATRQCWLYTPKDLRVDPRRRFPVVVLLHGAPGAPIDFLAKGRVTQIVDGLVAARSLPECIVAMPDGRGSGPRRSSMYVDAEGAGPAGAVESWIAKDLPRYLRERCNASGDPNLWTVGGLSEGAFGAANLVCRHPGQFRSAILLSGFFRPSVEPANAGALIGRDATAWQAYTPALTAAGLSPKADFAFVLSVGRDDGYDGGETRRFAGALQRLKVPCIVSVRPGGHFWSFWSEGIAVSLAEVGRLRRWPPPR